NQGTAGRATGEGAGRAACHGSRCSDPATLRPVTSSSSGPLPRAGWRFLVRSVLVALAVLALVGVAAPWAAPWTAPAAAALPGLGTGREIDVTLRPDGAVPWGLDLSGAQVQFRAGSTVGTCVTDRFGGCDLGFTSGRLSGTGTSDLALPKGTYQVSQLSGVV